MNFGCAPERSSRYSRKRLLFYVLPTLVGGASKLGRHKTQLVRCDMPLFVRAQITPDPIQEALADVQPSFTSVGAWALSNFHFVFLPFPIGVPFSSIQTGAWSLL